MVPPRPLESNSAAYRLCISEWQQRKQTVENTTVHWHCIRIQQIKRFFSFQFLSDSTTIASIKTMSTEGVSFVPAPSPTLHPNSAQKCAVTSSLRLDLRSSGGPKPWPGCGHPKLLTLIDCSQQVWSGTFFQRQGKQDFKARMSCEAYFIEMLPASHFHESSPSKQDQINYKHI